MHKYDKMFKKQAIKPADEINMKQVVPNWAFHTTLAEWQKRQAFGDHAFLSSGIYRDALFSKKLPH